MNLKACLVSTGVISIGVALVNGCVCRSENNSIDSSKTQTLETSWCGTPARHHSTNTFARTVSGNGLTVKVARRADVWVTVDGLNWIQRSSGVPNALHDVAYGQGVFVAVGNEGALVTSSDGVSWTPQNSRTDERLRGIAFGNGIFVAVGYAGIVITSKNGVKWTTRKSGTEERLQTVSFDDGVFVAVGRKGAILTSTNGTHWTVCKSGIADRLDGIGVTMVALCLASPTEPRGSQAMATSGLSP